jgi:hypothetical protein
MKHGEIENEIRSYCAWSIPVGSIKCGGGNKGGIIERQI